MLEDAIGGEHWRRKSVAGQVRSDSIDVVTRKEDRGGMVIIPSLRDSRRCVKVFSRSVAFPTNVLQSFQLRQRCHQPESRMLTALGHPL